jgi:hypothetical protein
MLTGFLILMVFELLGELLQAAFQVPVPGPVIGMFLLAAALIITEKASVRYFHDSWRISSETAELSERISLGRAWYIPTSSTRAPAGR